MSGAINSRPSAFDVLRALEDRIAQLEVARFIEPNFHGSTSWGHGDDDITNSVIGQRWVNQYFRRPFVHATLFPNAVVTGVNSNSGGVIQFAANNNFTTGLTVSVSGISPASLNVYGTITAATSTHFDVTVLTGADYPSGTYVSGGIAQVQTGIIKPAYDDIEPNAEAVGTAPSAAQDIQVRPGGVHWFTSNASTNTVLNFVGDSSGHGGMASISLNQYMMIGDVLTVTVFITNGATPYYPSAFKIDGSSVTPQWIGSAPSSGNANSTDLYTFVFIKTANATFKIIASAATAS